jgi:hypothetical protein
MKFLAQHDLYDNNNQAKFEGQKIHPKQVIWNLPTLVAAVETLVENMLQKNRSRFSIAVLLTTLICSH